MFDVLAGSVAQAIVAGSAEGVSGISLRRGVDRSERRENYVRFQQSVMKIQLRVELVFSVHSASQNPVHVAGWVAGYPLIVTTMNRLVDDFGELTYHWQRVRLIGTAATTADADALVLRVCELLQHVDPGWYKPRARRQRARALGAAKTALQAASANFDLAVRSDAGQTRAQRRKAQRSHRQSN